MSLEEEGIINQSISAANYTNSTNGSYKHIQFGDGDSQDGYFEFILYVVSVPILFGLVSLIGIIGNSLVIYVILSKQKMRTVTNLLLLNLALADFCFVLIVPPFTAYSWAAAKWPFGPIPCKMMHYLLNVTAYVTVYTLVLISIVRYLTIIYTNQTIQFRTKQNMVIMNVLIWVVMLAVNIPIIMSYTVIHQGLDDQCSTLGPHVPKAIYATLFAFAYVIPLLIIAILSICIIRFINKQKSSMMDKKTKSDARKKQATRVIILVVVLFAIFWLPIHIHLLICYYASCPEGNFYTAVSVFWNVLAYFNSCVNPIIYNYASKDFRDSFVEVVSWIPCMRTNNNRRTNSNENNTVLTRAAIQSTPNMGEMKRLVPTENGEQEKLMDVDV